VSLHQLAIDAATRYRRRPAVAGATGAVSYGDLDRKANALAVRMRALGVARGDRVVIWAEKSPDVVVAMQAVLRLGAAYVPVDPATPVARATAVIGDCAARLVCVTAARVTEAAGWPERGPPSRPRSATSAGV